MKMKREKNFEYIIRYKMMTECDREIERKTRLSWKNIYHKYFSQFDDRINYMIYTQMFDEK